MPGPAGNNLCFCVKAFCLLALVSYASGETVKLALIIGNNRGLGHEPTLQYAVQDARRIHRTLIELGGLESNRCYLLANSSKQNILDKLIEVSGRVKELKMQGKETQVFIYYSGHGSLEGLHIQGDKISLGEVKRIFQSLEADLKILISDACYAGALITRKGRKLPPLEKIHIYDTLGVTGSVILASSTEGEFSVESKEIKASFFTYYFNSGLNGAADDNHDGVITLNEAYQYTKRNIKQHGMTPKFEFNLRGTENVILTDVRKGECKLIFKNLKWGKYRVMNDINMKYVADVIIEDSTVVLNLPQSRYIIRNEGDKRYYIASKEMPWQDNYILTQQDFRGYSYDIMNPKGWAPRPNQWHLQTAVLSSLAEIRGPVYSAELLFQRIYGKFSFIPSLGYLFRTRIQEENMGIAYSGPHAGGEIRYSLFARLKGTAFAGLKAQYWRLSQLVSSNGTGGEGSGTTAGIITAAIVTGGSLNIPKTALMLSLEAGYGPHWYRRSGKNYAVMNTAFLVAPSVGWRF